MSGKKLASLILSFIGAIFMLIGLGLLAIGWSEAQAIEQRTGQVLGSAAQLGQTPSGVSVMLEGKIAERNSLLDQDLVAYIRSQYQGEHCVTPTPRNDNDDGGVSQCESIWTEEKRETPPLWLDLSDGRIQLANTDYRLQNPPVAWQSSTDLVKNQTVRYEGFKINNPVFTQGTVASGSDNLTFKADFLFGGDSQAYFDYQRSSNSILFLLGSIFTAVGTIALVVIGVILWTGRKNFSKT